MLSSRAQILETRSRMQCLVINLDRSPDRLAHMQAEFGRIGLPFRRVPAVDALERPELAREAPPVNPGWKLTPRLTALELGCALSHRACWEIVAAGHEPYGAVFEDDIVLGDAAGALLTDADWIPADADLVKLETFMEKVLIGRHRHAAGHGYSTARLRSPHTGCGGYIVSRAAARRLLDVAAKIDMPVDHMLFDLFFPTARDLLAYQLVPALCIQHQHLVDGRFAGLIEPERCGMRQTVDTARGKKTLGARLRKETGRLLAQAGRAWTMRRLVVPFGHPQPPAGGAHRYTAPAKRAIDPA